jgi:hypothetical protein
MTSGSGSSDGVRRDSTATRLLVRVIAKRRLEHQRSHAGSEFSAGEAVEVQGLRGAPEHNGKRGHILRFDKKRGRYLVRLDGVVKATDTGDIDSTKVQEEEAEGTKPLGLKASNLLRHELQQKQPQPQQPTGPVWRGATFGHIQKLQSHLSELPPARLESMRTVARGLSSIPGLNGVGVGGGGDTSCPPLSENELLQLLGAVQCNSQGIVDLEHHKRLGAHATKRGELLSAPYDINHSCDPNTWVSVNGDCVQFR